MDATVKQEIRYSRRIYLLFSLICCRKQSEHIGPVRKDTKCIIIPTDTTQIALALLPTSEDDKRLRTNITIIVSRVLVNNFKLTYDGVVQWPYTAQVLQRNGQEVGSCISKQ